MNLTFRRFVAGDADALVAFLSGEPWPFHVTANVSEEHARRRIDDGDFDGAATRSFWIIKGAETVGLVTLDDLGELSPMFDLRIRARHRRRGLGAQTVRWLTAHLFTEFPDILRIEANTRKDNIAMRRTFLSCGYVKESHYRDAWPSAEDGSVHDGIGYAIIRRDRVSGTTTVPTGTTSQPNLCRCVGESDHRPGSAWSASRHGRAVSAASWRRPPSRTSAASPTRRPDTRRAAWAGAGR
jgi:RimJ/RimL family protein N-acetyltransferase